MISQGVFVMSAPFILQNYINFLILLYRNLQLSPYEIAKDRRPEQVSLYCPDYFPNKSS